MESKKLLKKYAYVINISKFDELSKFAYAAFCYVVNEINTLDMQKDEILYMLNLVKQRINGANVTISLDSFLSDSSNPENDFWLENLCVYFRNKSILFEKKDGKLIEESKREFANNAELADFLYNKLCLKPKLISPIPSFKQPGIVAKIYIADIPNVNKHFLSFLRKIEDGNEVSLKYPTIGSVHIKKSEDYYYINEENAKLSLEDAVSKMLNILDNEVCVIRVIYDSDFKYSSEYVMAAKTHDIMINVRSVLLEASSRSNYEDIFYSSFYHECLHVIQSLAYVGYSSAYAQKFPNIYGTSKKLDKTHEGKSAEVSAHLSGPANLARKKYEKANNEDKKILENLIFIPYHDVPVKFLYIKEEIDRVTSKIKDPKMLRKIQKRYLEVLQETK